DPRYFQSKTSHRHSPGVVDREIAICNSRCPACRPLASMGAIGSPQAVVPAQSLACALPMSMPGSAITGSLCLGARLACTGFWSCAPSTRKWRARSSGHGWSVVLE
ncbi:UNVERIFIED_CONTAM: hypothetical protein Sindi_2869500, partial [Sesamum indicum]